MKDRNGLHFQGDSSSFHSAGGVALTRGPLFLPQGGSQGVSIEIWLQPKADLGGEIYHILGFYERDKKVSFFVGQWKSYLVLRKFFFGPDHKRHYREIDVKGTLESAKASFLTITSDENGTAVYLNGKKMRDVRSFFLLSKGESLSNYSILLGNSTSAEGAWSGNVMGLAIFDRSLTPEEAYGGFKRWTEGESPSFSNESGPVGLYLFNERSGGTAYNAMGVYNPLLIPSVLPFEKEALSPLDFSRHNDRDMIVNVLGFIPFGFLLVLWMRQRRPSRPYNAFVWAVLIGVLVSLTIELVQVYLPTRDSSQMDLLCNAVGTIVGGIMGLAKNVFRAE